MIKIKPCSVSVSKMPVSGGVCIHQRNGGIVAVTLVEHQDVVISIGFDHFAPGLLGFGISYFYKSLICNGIKKANSQAFICTSRNFQGIQQVYG